MLVCFGCRRNVSSFGALFILCCFDGSFAPTMSHSTELEKLEAVLATQELLAFESVNISECLGVEFDKNACFQKPATLNKIEQKIKRQYSNSTNVYRVCDEYRNTHIETLRDEYRPIPVDLGTNPVEEVNYWLKRFILEVLRGYGKPYPYPRSIYSLVCSFPHKCALYRSY